MAKASLSTLPPMLANNYQRDWPAYFDAVAGQPARQTLLIALEHCKPVGAEFGGSLMLDIACGAGRDTLAALAHDDAWRVVATDTSADGLARLRRALQQVGLEQRALLAEVSMEELPAWWQQRSASEGLGSPLLINASFALPFCDPEKFPGLWAFMRSVLAPGGCFAGQFFGDRDEWAQIRPRSHYTREAVHRLLGDFTLLHFEEVDKVGSDAMGGSKHHHVFHVVARRPEKDGTLGA